MRQAGRLQEVYEKYRERVDFHWVYIREAHPTGSRRPARHVRIGQPSTFEERLEVAKKCSTEISLGIPQLVDDLENTVATAYAAWPDRLFILGKDSRIAYAGDRGPRGFRVDEMEAALARLTRAK